VSVTIEPMAKRKPASKPAGRPWKVRLREWRERSGLTQADAAAKLGASLRTYVYWEAGKYDPDRRYQAVLERYEI
jgi:DNA-binding XRE family transcriptional regulator